MLSESTFSSWSHDSMRKWSVRETKYKVPPGGRTNTSSELSARHLSLLCDITLGSFSFFFQQICLTLWLSSAAHQQNGVTSADPWVLFIYSKFWNGADQRLHPSCGPTSLRPPPFVVFPANWGLLFSFFFFANSLSSEGILFRGYWLFIFEIAGEW